MAKQNIKFDRTDYEILQAIKQSESNALSAIAEKLGLNDRTARRRLSKMTEAGALRKSYMTSPSFFGFNSIVDINLSVKQDVYKDFLQECKKNTNIAYIASGLGKSNLALQARFRNNEDMYDFINDYLPSCPGVDVVDFFIIPKIIYSIDEWIPDVDSFLDESS